MKYVLSVDPGKATGMALFSYSTGQEPMLVWAGEYQQEEYAEPIRKTLKEHPDVEIAGKNIERALPYVYAKRKAIEVSGHIDVNHEEQNKTVEFLKSLASKGRLKIEPNKP